MFAFGKGATPYTERFRSCRSCAFIGSAFRAGMFANDQPIAWHELTNVGETTSCYLVAEKKYEPVPVAEQTAGNPKQGDVDVQLTSARPLAEPPSEIRSRNMCAGSRRGPMQGSMGRLNV